MIGRQGLTWEAPSISAFSHAWEKDVRHGVRHGVQNSVQNGVVIYAIKVLVRQESVFDRFPSICLTRGVVIKSRGEHAWL